MTSAQKKPSEQEIVAHFQKLRDEQRIIASKAAELQVEQKSHELVLETLKDVDKARKCYRMIGGVLVERTVNEVMPALEQNKDQVRTPSNNNNNNKHKNISCIFFIISCIS